MDATAVEIGSIPVSKNEQADAGPDGRTHLARSSSLARTGTGKYSFSLFS